MADVEALMIASRDYYTHNHCSCAHAGGHFAQSGNFPSHCVHGTASSKFLSEIAGALESAMITHGPERVFVRCTNRLTPSVSHTQRCGSVSFAHARSLSPSLPPSFSRLLQGDEGICDLQEGSARGLCGHHYFREMSLEASRKK